MASRTFLLACLLLLAASSALAQRGPPGGGPPGGPGGPCGGPSGPGGSGGKEPRGPPLNLTAVGNLTADVGARLANCSADQKVFDGRFHLAVFKNSSGNYNLLVEALLVDAAGSPPDSLAIVQGAVCDAAATAVLSLPVAASDWQQRAGWWLLHAEARLDAFLENADAATVDALIAVLPNATVPRKNGGGGGGAGAGGVRNGQGGRRMGRELLMRAVGKQGGKKQGGAQQQPPAGGFSGGFPGGNGGVNSTVSGYAVLAGSSMTSVTWGGQLVGVKMPAASASA